MVIPPTIFVLGVTLLGHAVEKSKQEEKAARESESSNIKEELSELQDQLKEAKSNGNTTTLYTTIEKLKEKQKETENKIQEIKIKYSSVNLHNTVVYPSLAFVLFLGINELNLYLYKNNEMLLFVALLIIEVCLIFFGLLKIYKSLNLIQEISLNKKEEDYFDKITETIKSALTQYEQNKKEEVSIEFTSKVFPLNVTCSTELKIDFRVRLKKGSLLQDVEIWFFIPDEFELINPTESWRQSASFISPNIRTVKVKVGDLSVGPFSRRSLEIKTPPLSGNYSIRYSIKGLGYYGETRELKLIAG